MEIKYPYNEYGNVELLYQNLINNKAEMTTRLMYSGRF